MATIEATISGGGPLVDPAGLWLNAIRFEAPSGQHVVQGFFQL